MTIAERRKRQAALPPLRWHDTVVTGIRNVTARMVRVTLAGASIRSFASTGPDEHFKLILPRTRDPLPAFDLGGNVYAQWRALPDEVRPILRTYTVRELRREAGELDVDVALHAGGTPAMRWLEALRLGDACAIYGTRSEFDPPPGTRHVLLLADDAGTPALARILASLPDAMPADAVIQTGGPDDVQPLRHGSAARVTWTHAGDDAADDAADRATDATAGAGGSGKVGSGGLDGLVRALARLEPPSEPWYAWAAGAAEALPGLRSALRGLPGHHRDRLELVGYWRADGPVDPN
jgi:NADPH-dependent ferric siderophore reductase